MVFSQCEAVLIVTKVVRFPRVPVKPGTDMVRWKIDSFDIGLNVLLKIGYLDTHQAIVSFI